MYSDHHAISLHIHTELGDDQRGIFQNVEYYLAVPPGTPCQAGEFITESWQCHEARLVIPRLKRAMAALIDVPVNKYMQVKVYVVAVFEKQSIPTKGRRY